MAEIDVAQEWEPYQGRNPTTGKVGTYIRVRHNRIRSRKLEGFLHCVQGHLEGRRYRTGNPEEDSREVRAAMARAAEECKAQLPRQ